MQKLVLQPKEVYQHTHKVQYFNKMFYFTTQMGLNMEIQQNRIQQNVIGAVNKNISKQQVVAVCL